MHHRPRLRTLADLEGRIARAEAEVARWARTVELMGAAGEPTRAAHLYLRVVRNDLDRLGRLRDARPADDGGGEGFGEGERRKA